jgi:hypothetical protein
MTTAISSVIYIRREAHVGRWAKGETSLFRSNEITRGHVGMSRATLDQFRLLASRLRHQFLILHHSACLALHAGFPRVYHPCGHTPANRRGIVLKHFWAFVKSHTSKQPRRSTRTVYVVMRFRECALGRKQRYRLNRFGVFYRSAQILGEVAGIRDTTTVWRLT